MATVSCLGLLYNATDDIIDLHKDLQGFVVDCLDAFFYNYQGFRYNSSQRMNLCHAFIVKLSKYLSNNWHLGSPVEELRFTKNIKCINVPKLGHRGENVMLRSWKEMYRVVKEARMYLQDCSNEEKWWMKSITSSIGGEAYVLHIHDLVWSVICLDMNYLYLQAGTELSYSETACRKFSDFHAEMSNLTRIHDEYQDTKRLIFTFQQLLKTSEMAADDDDDIEQRNKLRIAKFLSAKLQATIRGEPAVIGTRICSWLQIDSKDLIPNLRLIGSGNFGNVYEGFWLGVKVAVKEIPLSGGDMGYLAPEIAAHAKLQSPFVVQLIGICITDAHCYFVMELVSSSLEKILEDRSEGHMPPLSLPVAVDMMLQISRGMEYLHSQSIMHMDLKSSNVLIQPSALPKFRYHGYGQVKICDFGDASLRLCSFRYPEDAKGTGQWRAPEVFSYAQQDLKIEINSPKEYTYKADVYSFAMTCYEILTGKHPFGDVLSEKAIYGMIIRGKRPSLPPSCPSVLADFIKKCWDTDPNRRPCFEKISNFMRYMKLLIMRITDSGDQVSLSAICRDFDKAQLVKCECNEEEESDDRPPSSVEERLIIRALERDFPGYFQYRCFLQQSAPDYIQKYSYRCVQNITNNFSEELGGVSCLMWKGALSDGTQVAVKNISMAEIRMLCEMHHPNAVRLRCVCLPGVSGGGYGVFDHMLMGSLAAKLFLPRSILSWNIRKKIGLGIARFLAYLHNDHIKRFLNIQINATNVYLDERFTPKLGGFEFILPTEENTESLELALQFEEFRNVRDFGVILLELLTGRRWENMQYSLQSIHDSIQGEGGYKFLGERLLDRELEGEVDMGEAMRWVRIALWCFVRSPLREPNMNKVVLAMKGLFDVSSLPEYKMYLVDNFTMEKSEMATAWEVVREFSSLAWGVDRAGVREFATLRKSILPNNPILYRFQEIADATKQFTTGRIGKSVWKSNLREKIVAIKISKVNNIKDFRSGVRQICSAHHANIINLLGGCCEGEHMYLVYEYVLGANLADCLRSNTVNNEWTFRMMIARDVAHALEYMHHYSIINYVHNYLKSSSIIITAGARTRICHVGASYLAGEYDIHDIHVDLGSPKDKVVSGEITKSEEGNFQGLKFPRRSRSMKIRGTHGDMASEYVGPGIVSQKNDVYAFGVILLELLTGYEPVRYVTKHNGQLQRVSLVESTNTLFCDDGKRNDTDRLRKWMDPKLNDSFPVDCAEGVARLAVFCVNPDPHKRPDMRYVVEKLLFSAFPTVAQKIYNLHI